MQNLEFSKEGIQQLNEVLGNILTGYASIDKPWLKYYDKLFDEKELPQMSMFQLAYNCNLNNLANTALDIRVSKNHFKKGIAITYQELFDRIKQSAKSSQALGISKDDIVPIILPNIPEARIMIYSNNIVGSVSYPISPLLPSKQLDAIISENGIRNLVIFSALYEKYRKVLENNPYLHNVIYLDGTESLPLPLKALANIKSKLARNNSMPKSNRIIPWSEYEKLSRGVKEDIIPTYEKDHVTAIIGTSGTTGVPKGVCLTDDNINAGAISYVDGKLFKGSFLDALLPSIGYGISMLHYQTVAGHMVYLVPELVTDKIAEAVCTMKPDNFPGGPVHYINLANSEQFKNGQLPRAYNMVSGGASLPHEIESTLNKVSDGFEEIDGVDARIYVRQGYGLSENVATGTFSLRGAYKFGSIGIPVPYETIAIFKPDTDEELKYNEPGEICITGPTVMKGYLNNLEETDKVVKVHKDGKRWIHTKDIGYMDENGHIFHVERIKNIFMRTGFNVHPSKIAEFINTIPFVKNSCVIGFDHAKEQCVPIAFVVIDEHCQMSKEEIFNELRQACYHNLEETSVPFDFVLVDELPINVGGKIDIQTIKKDANIDLMHNDKVLVKQLSFRK